MSDVVDPSYLSLVRERLELLNERIRNAGGDKSDIIIVAVTKTFEIKACLSALALGLVDLGENFANELVDKASELTTLPPTTLKVKPTWHFLGNVQRNKLARLAPYVAVYESVDRMEEAAAIPRNAPGATIYVEVKVQQSETKGGVAVDRVEHFVGQCRELGLDVAGLMTVAPQDDPQAARQSFSTIRSMVDRLGLNVASMGMSDDLEIAVQEGATHLRIGRALFGPRHAR